MINTKYNYSGYRVYNNNIDDNTNFQFAHLSAHFYPLTIADALQQHTLS